MQFSLKNIPFWGISVAIIIISLLFASFTLGYMKRELIETRQFSHPVVIVAARGGSSSAVHIGRGYFLASNHGIGPAETSVELHSPDEEEKHIATVMWKSLLYDIALIHAPTLETLDSYSLSCDILTVGQQLQFHGNPGNMTGITTWGRVAGLERESPESPWKTYVPVDGVIIPGMSGGSVTDERNRLVGIMVGTLVMSPNFMSSTFTGISYIIPGNRLCDLLHRS
jgi:S1-C subfamily serine protease